MISFECYPTGDEIGDKLAEDVEAAAEALAESGDTLSHRDEEEFIDALRAGNMVAIVRLRDILTRALDEKR